MCNDDLTTYYEAIDKRRNTVEKLFRAPFKFHLGKLCMMIGIFYRAFHHSSLKLPLYNP